MFDPTIGRWLQEDPIDFEGGDANLYRMTGNDLLNRTDRNGLEATDGAKSSIAARVDKLNWPAEQKAKIKAHLTKLVDTAQFDWFRSRGAFGYCHQWVDEFYSKVKERLPDLLFNGIRVWRKEWKVNDFFRLGGHAGVMISGSSGFRVGNLYCTHGHNSTTGDEPCAMLMSFASSWRCHDLGASRK